jgi:chromosome segregation ATPase
MKLLSFVGMMSLVGCALLQPGADQAIAVDGIVGEVMNAARASSAEQKAALARAQQLFMNDSTALNRLRLAALLATLPASLRDDARASELLEPLADANAPGVGRLAALLASHVAERQRLTREIERLGKERANVERERQNADKERDKREEGLRQQLEALRAIERGILDREERLRSKPGAKP